MSGATFWRVHLALLGTLVSRLRTTFQLQVLTVLIASLNIMFETITPKRFTKSLNLIVIICLTLIFWELKVGHGSSVHLTVIEIFVKEFK